MQARVFLLISVLLVGCQANNLASTPTPTPSLSTAVPTQTIATPTTQPTTNNLITNNPKPLSNPQSPISSSPIFTQLTSGGCCVQPFFLADGVHVAFLDRPSTQTTTGIYAVPINSPLVQPSLLTQKLGPFSRDLNYSADLLSRQTFVERASDGTKFPINNAGRNISFSPDSKRIAWTVGEDAGNFDVRRNEIWLANMDGSAAKPIATRFGGGLVAWFNHSARMLISGKPTRKDTAPTLAILNLDDGNITPLFTAERLRGVALAPDDRHVVFFIAQAQDQSLDGMYLLALDQPNPQPQRLNFFGAYKWRDANHLLYIPLKLNTPSHELWQLDATTGQSELLIAANADSPFRVANGDWDVSGDGKHLVFVNARDRNLWLVRLP